MEFLTEEKFQEARKTDPYLADRWRYMGPAIELARKYFQDRPLLKVLEIGARKLKLCCPSDSMDIAFCPPLQAGERHLWQDASYMPWWNIQNKEYDLVIALQVFEHLDADGKDQRDPSRRGAQIRAFFEIRRVARSAIISLPIDWQTPSLTDCHSRISYKQALEWFDPYVPDDVITTFAERPDKRVIYGFSNL